MKIPEWNVNEDFTRQCVGSKELCNGDFCRKDCFPGYTSISSPRFQLPLISIPSDYLTSAHNSPLCFVVNSNSTVIATSQVVCITVVVFLHDVKWMKWANETIYRSILDFLSYFCRSVDYERLKYLVLQSNRHSTPMIIRPCDCNIKIGYQSRYFLVTLAGSMLRPCKSRVESAKKPRLIANFGSRSRNFKITLHRAREKKLREKIRVVR